MTRKLFFIAALAAVSFMSGCEPDGLSGSASGTTEDDKDGQETVDDSVLKLVSFSFLRQDNPSLHEDIRTTVSSGSVNDGAGVDYYVDPGSLVASFELFSADDLEDVSLSVGVKGSETFMPVESGRTGADYMRPVTIRLSGFRGGKEVIRDYDFRFHNLNTGVPVVYLFTPGGEAITSKDDWTGKCRIYIDAEGKKDYDGTVFEEDYYGEEDQLKGRGNTTWGWNKKPYAVKLDKKAGLLGMPKHKRWALLANAIDKSMLRNRLAFGIADRCDGLEWTPRNRFVELVMNGKHEGAYLLVEQIRTDKDRVPVPSGNDALDPEEGGGPDADPSAMGFLIEIDRYWGNDQFEKSPFWWPSGRYSGNGTTTSINGDRVSWAAGTSYQTNYDEGRLKMNFGLKDPDDEQFFNTDSRQFRYIRDYMLETEKMVLQGSHDMSRLDVDSFIDYWLVFELALNQEPNNPGSCYMYKKPESEGGGIFAGPVWDFDYGTFNAGFTDGLYYGKNDRFLILNSLWYVGLFENAGFRNAVRERWHKLKPQFEAMESYIEQNRAYIGKSAALNFNVWPIAETGSGDPNGEDGMTVDESIDRVKANFIQRIKDLDRLISSMP